MRFKLGSLDVEFGGLMHKSFGLWLPDGLHIWLGRRGVHLFWSHSPYMPRISFDREPSSETTTNPGGEDG